MRKFTFKRSETEKSDFFSLTDCYWQLINRCSFNITDHHPSTNAVSHQLQSPAQSYHQDFKKAPHQRAQIMNGVSPQSCWMLIWENRDRRFVLEICKPDTRERLCRFFVSAVMLLFSWLNRLTLFHVSEAEHCDVTDVYCKDTDTGMDLSAETLLKGHTTCT